MRIRDYCLNLRRNAVTSEVGLGLSPATVSDITLQLQLSRETRS